MHPRTTILSPIILIAVGCIWGYLWTIALYILFFVFIAPIVNILVYRYIGNRLHQILNASSLKHSHQLGLATLSIAMFYIGNRVILFGWTREMWPYQENQFYWLLATMDVISLGIGLAIATGLYQPNHDHQTHPNET